MNDLIIISLGLAIGNILISIVNLILLSILQMKHHTWYYIKRDVDDLPTLGDEDEKL